MKPSWCQFFFYFVEFSEWLPAGLSPIVETLQCNGVTVTPFHVCIVQLVHRTFTGLRLHILTSSINSIPAICFKMHNPLKDALLTILTALLWSLMLGSAFVLHVFPPHLNTVCRWGATTSHSANVKADRENLLCLGMVQPSLPSVIPASGSIDVS